MGTYPRGSAAHQRDIAILSEASRGIAVAPDVEVQKMTVKASSSGPANNGIKSELHQAPFSRLTALVEDARQLPVEGQNAAPRENLLRRLNRRLARCHATTIATLLQL
jgi:hypothetical protein